MRRWSPAKATPTGGSPWSTPWAKAEPARLRAALTGRVTDRHRILLRPHLGQHDALAAALAEVDAEMERDLGSDHFLKRAPEQQAQRLARQIAKLGFACTITPQAEPVSI